MESPRIKDFKYLKLVNTSEFTPKSATEEVSTRRAPRSGIEADDRPRDEATNYTIVLQLNGICLVYSFRSSTLVMSKKTKRLHRSVCRAETVSNVPPSARSIIAR